MAELLGTITLPYIHPNTGTLSRAPGALPYRKRACAGSSLDSRGLKKMPSHTYADFGLAHQNQGGTSLVNTLLESVACAHVCSGRQCVGSWGWEANLSGNRAEGCAEDDPRHETAGHCLTSVGRQPLLGESCAASCLSSPNSVMTILRRQRHVLPHRRLPSR